MIEKYGLFDSLEGDERIYAEADLALMVRALGNDGVRGGVNALKVHPAAAGLGVRVESGYAVIQGRYYALEDDGSGEMEIALTTAAANPRIDRIVLRLNYSERTVKLGLLSGTEAVTPEPPALTRATGEYMLSLAQVRVGVGAASLTEADITDERPDSALCGVYVISADDAYTAAGKASEAAAQANEAAQSAAQAAQNAQKTGDSARSEAAAAKAAADTKAVRAVYTATLTAGGWSVSAPYTQTVTVAGLKAADMPVVDVDMSAATADTAAEIQGAYALIGRMTTGENKMTAYCYEEKPEMNLGLNLLVVR